MAKTDTGTLTIRFDPGRGKPKTRAQIQQDADALDEIRRAVADYLDPGNMAPSRHFDTMNRIIHIIDTKTDFPTLEVVRFEPDEDGTQTH